MTVVGVWSVNDPRALVRRLLPNAPRVVVANATALAGDHFEQNVALVGERPTQSRISATPDGLVLERGPAWTAPIYYRLAPTVASSNITPLIEPSSRANERRLAGTIGHVNRYDEGRTAYGDIHLVRPFETVTLSDRRLSRRTSSPSIEPIKTTSIPALATQLRELLFAAISRAVGSRRVGLMLSGGVDSSTLLAVLLALRGARSHEIESATLDFDAPGSDRPYVRALEKHYGIVVQRVSPEDIHPKHAMIMDGVPSRHPGDMWVLSCAKRLRDHGAEVLMTGTGGDMMFGGDVSVAVATALASGHIVNALDVLRAQYPQEITYRSCVKLLLSIGVRRYVPTWVRRVRAGNALRKIPPWVGPALRAELVAGTQERVEAPARHDLQSRFDRLLRNPMDSEYGAEPRAQTDYVGELPRVDPIYDADLVAFLSAIQPDTLFAGRMYRGLVREAMRGLLPEIVRRRADKADFEPAMARAVAPFERFEELLTFEALAHAGIVNAAQFRTYLRPLLHAPSEAANGEAWMLFWPALCAESFFRGRV